MIDILNTFLRSPPKKAGRIYDERSLQLELAYYLRCEDLKVEFERPFAADRPAGSTEKPKTKLDLLVFSEVGTVAIELKVPLNKQHPETLFKFCGDLEFVEALVRSGQVDRGFCLMMTNDHLFWQDTGRGSAIHDNFRREGQTLTGVIGKPTGTQNTAIVLTGQYNPANQWRELNCPRLMDGAKYLLIEVHP